VGFLLSFLPHLRSLATPPTDPELDRLALYVNLAKLATAGKDALTVLPDVMTVLLRAAQDTPRIAAAFDAYNSQVGFLAGDEVLEFIALAPDHKRWHEEAVRLVLRILWSNPHLQPRIASDKVDGIYGQVLIATGEKE